MEAVQLERAMRRAPVAEAIEAWLENVEHDDTPFSHSRRR
jgi:hypothetical protein